MPNGAITCPRCGAAAPRALGRSGSPFEWYACPACHHVWAAGVSIPAQAPAPQSNPNGRRHVLVVDDDTNTLALVERTLVDCRVTRARDGGEALAILATDATVDLLLTDYLMPVMTGEELVRRARVQRPDLKVLVMTGHGHAVAVADPEWWASERHVSKPFRLDVLRRAVEETLG
jgi:CheY-like chemotaxis protein